MGNSCGHSVLLTQSLTAKRLHLLNGAVWTLVKTLSLHPKARRDGEPVVRQLGTSIFDAAEQLTKVVLVINLKIAKARSSRYHGRCSLNPTN